MLPVVKEKFDAEVSARIDSIAAVLNENLSLDDAAALHGETPDELLALAERHEHEVNRRTALAKIDGRAITGTSQKILGNALRQLADRVEKGDMSATMLLKIVDSMHRVSGLATRQETKAPGSGFSIQIVLSGKPEDTITIGKSALEGEVIDVE